MREIKFRGKRIDNGEWVYGSLLNDFGGDRWIVNTTQDIKNANTENVWHKVNPDTVGQYTGLKDINGKEIYEGDIVRHDYGFESGKGIVCYSAPNLELKHLNKNEVINDFTWDEWELFEIIGNIHDNLELVGEP